MKKTMTLTLFALICLNLFAGSARAYEMTGSVEEKPAIIDASLQREIDGLNLEVDELVKRVEATQPFGTRDEQRRQFFALDTEIDQLDDKIDLLEDRVKADYIAGTLTWQEYRRIERGLDALEDRLDRAEDLLEKRFGIDD